MPLWSIFELSELETEQLLIDFLRLFDHSLAREVFFDFLTIKVKFFLEHLAAIERVVPRLKGGILVFCEVFLKLNEFLSLLGSLFGDELGQILLKFLDSLRVSGHFLL